MNEGIEQAANKPCPECGGQRVVTKATTGANLYIVTGVMSGTMTIPICCTNCGYTTLYAAEPYKVRNHYLKRQ
jgi:predicted nucleic-acid-binding Zn-ribbon protein